jgi:hypothetical protein
MMPGDVSGVATVDGILAILACPRYVDIRKYARACQCSMWHFNHPWLSLFLSGCDSHIAWLSDDKGAGEIRSMFPDELAYCAR